MFNKLVEVKVLAVVGDVKKESVVELPLVLALEEVDEFIEEFTLQNGQQDFTVNKEINSSLITVKLDYHNKDAKLTIEARVIPDHLIKVEEDHLFDHLHNLEYINSTASLEHEVVLRKITKDLAKEIRLEFDYTDIWEELESGFLTPYLNKNNMDYSRVAEVLELTESEYAFLLSYNGGPEDEVVRVIDLDEFKVEDYQDNVLESSCLLVVDDEIVKVAIGLSGEFNAAEHLGEHLEHI